MVLSSQKVLVMVVSGFQKKNMHLELCKNPSSDQNKK